MQDFIEIARGLRFPEGPVALTDGTFLVVEIERQTLTRILRDGRLEVVAELGGGPNGVAIGPDGRAYVCNNGGLSFSRMGDQLVPGFAPPDYAGGWIDAVDLTNGDSERLYAVGGKYSLRGPNDIVFDSHGGFYFTDLGKTFKSSTQRDRGAVYYATIDGKSIRRTVFPMEGPNGIGLSPDEKILYVAESTTGRVWAFDLGMPGEIRRHDGPVSWERGRLLWAPNYYSTLDSLALDSAGNICVADIPFGGITVISPEGEKIAQVATGDPFTTNICFGGADLKTAFMTLSSTGVLLSMQWPRPGLPLAWLNRTDESQVSGLGNSGD